MENRTIRKSDIPALKEVLDHCDLFPSEYLDEMIAPFFEDAESQDIWITSETDSKVTALAYCAPMTFTNKTYNLYAIGVHEEYQRKGVGRSILQFLEAKLKENNARVLIVETSSLPAQENARKFYLQNGYEKEATLRDFWDDGDDKIVFWKKF